MRRPLAARCPGKGSARRWCLRRPSVLRPPPLTRYALSHPARPRRVRRSSEVSGEARWDLRRGTGRGGGVTGGAGPSRAQVAMAPPPTPVPRPPRVVLLPVPGSAVLVRDPESPVRACTLGGNNAIMLVELCRLAYYKNNPQLRHLSVLGYDGANTKKTLFLDSDREAGGPAAMLTALPSLGAFGGAQPAVQGVCSIN